MIVKEIIWKRHPIQRCGEQNVVGQKVAEQNKLQDKMVLPQKEDKEEVVKNNIKQRVVRGSTRGGQGSLGEVGQCQGKEQGQRVQHVQMKRVRHGDHQQHGHQQYQQHQLLQCELL